MSTYLICDQGSNEKKAQFNEISKTKLEYKKLRRNKTKQNKKQNRTNETILIYPNS